MDFGETQFLTSFCTDVWIGPHHFQSFLPSTDTLKCRHSTSCPGVQVFSSFLCYLTIVFTTGWSQHCLLHVSFTSSYSNFLPIFSSLFPSFTLSPLAPSYWQGKCCLLLWAQLTCDHFDKFSLQHNHSASLSEIYKSVFLNIVCIRESPSQESLGTHNV